MSKHEKPSWQKPEMAVQRAMIEQKRDQFRAGGFEADLEVSILSVQEPSGEEEAKQLAKAIADARGKAQNCYRSAEELSRLLAKLPKPKAEKPNQ